MKYLRRTWQDIRRGENIDLYVLVAVAGVTAVLSMTDIVPQAGLRHSRYLSLHCFRL